MQALYIHCGRQLVHCSHTNQPDSLCKETCSGWNAKTKWAVAIPSGLGNWWDAVYLVEIPTTQLCKLRKVKWSRDLCDQWSTELSDPHKQG